MNLGQAGRLLLLANANFENIPCDTWLGIFVYRGFIEGRYFSSLKVQKCIHVHLRVQFSLSRVACGIT